MRRILKRFEERMGCAEERQLEGEGWAGKGNRVDPKRRVVGEGRKEEIEKTRLRT